MPASSCERDQNLEQYLSRNRMNRRLQAPMKTAFSGLTRLTEDRLRRTSATIGHPERMKLDYANFEKSFKSRILKTPNLSIPIFGNYCCEL
jgi:hypothetical protein